MILTFATVLGALYGPSVATFSTMKSAIIAVTMITLGDWGDAYYGILGITDYPAMWTSVFVLYNVVVIIVTMNIFLSIVLDAYSVVKDFMAEEEAKISRQTQQIGNSTVPATLEKQRTMMQILQKLNETRGKK